MPVINISNGTIDEISKEQGTTFVTVTYLGGPRNRRMEQTVRLVVGPRTVILNPNGIPVPAAALRTGITEVLQQSGIVIFHQGSDSTFRKML